MDKQTFEKLLLSIKKQAEEILVKPENATEKKVELQRQSNQAKQRVVSA